MSHDEAAELLGAYALDAVDPDEAAAIGEHLATCPQCSAELAAHHEVAAMLGNAGGDAPAHLWDRLSEQITVARPPEGGGEMLDFLRPAGNGGAARARRRRPPFASNPFTLSAAALAAAAVVVVALLGWQVHRLDGNVRQLQSGSEQSGVSQAALAALTDPAARLVSLDANPASAGGTRLVEIAVLPSGAAYLVNSGLPALPGEQTYQLWGQVGSQLISLGLLGSDPGAVAFRVNPSAPVTLFAITAEHAGGVVRTTHTPVAVSPTLTA